MSTIKPIDSIDQRLNELESVLEHVKVHVPRLSKQVQGDILKLKAGHSAEKNTAHLLDKLFQNSKQSILIHDLRLEINGDVAQIDHLALNRFGFAILFETKSFSTGIKIDDDGIFWRWDGYKKQYIEIPSPLLQSERHEGTLKQALLTIEYPLALMNHYVLVDYKAKLIKPKNGKFDNVCRPDRLEEVWKKEESNQPSMTEMGAAFKAIGRLLGGKIPNKEGLIRQGEELVKLHTPLNTDVWARYGLTKPVEPTSNTLQNELEATKTETVTETAPEQQYLSSSKAAKQLKLTTQAFLEKSANAGLVVLEGDTYFATDKGMKFGLENKKFRNIAYVSWPISVIERIGKKSK